MQKVKEGKGGFGYNAATDTFEDLIEAGVIDPTKVVRSALQNAASVASLLITTEALVAETSEARGLGPGRRRRRRRHARHVNVRAAGARPSPSPSIDCGTLKGFRTSRDGATAGNPPAPHANGGRGLGEGGGR